MPKNLRKRGRIWWYKVRKRGKDYEGSLETENLGVAQERLKRILEELKASRWGEKPRRTFNEAAERFGIERFKTLKPSSAARYVVSIANLLEELDGVFLDEIGTARLGDFERRRKTDNVTGSTIRRDLACLSAIYSMAEYWEWTDRNPVKPFLRERSRSGLKEGDPRNRALDADEEKEVIACASPKASRGIIVAIDTGLRKEEQLSLMWPDVDFRARHLLVRAEVTKTGKPRHVPLLPRTLNLLMEMRREIAGPYVFTTHQGRRYSRASPYFYEALQKAVRKANALRAKTNREPMPHVEWHDLRRTCGCRLLQDRKFSMEEVSRWLGHSSVKVTERHYAFLKIEQLHEAVDRSESRVVQLHRPAN